MKNAWMLLAIVGMLLLAGCTQLDSLTGSGGSSGPASYDKTGAMPESAPNRAGGAFMAAPSPASISSSQKLIKTANAEVEVPAGTVQERYAKLSGLVAAQGGQIVSADYSESGDTKEYNVQIKIRPEKFEGLAPLLQGLGAVKAMNTNVQDVSDQYVDLDTRIRNLEIQRDDLRKLFERNGTLEDVLAVENELTRVQTEIEMYQNQKLNMDRQVTLSAVSVRLYEQAPAVGRDVLSPLGDVGNVFLGVLGVTIVIIAGGLGFGIPAAIVGGIVYLLYRRFFPKKAEKTAVPGKTGKNGKR
jgi:hypothetical protein